MSLQPGKAVRRSVSATEDQIVALLDKLDAELQTDGGEQQDAEHLQYRFDSCEVALQQIGSATAFLFVVPTRHISATGMSFLHSGFVHTGSKCKMDLVANNGIAAKVDAVVTGCRYVDNWMHEVCADFVTEIHAESFCKAKPEWAVVVAAPDEEAARYAKHYLTVQRADVHVASDGNELVTLAADGHFDCLLVELDLPGLSGIEAVTAIREAGYEGVIFGITEEGDTSKSDEAIAAGCARCLSKPYTAEMAEVVYTAVVGSSTDGGAETDGDAGKGSDAGTDTDTDAGTDTGTDTDAGAKAA